MQTETEAILRLCVFLGLLTVMMVWERLAPRRRLTRKRFQRWFVNLGLVILNTLLLRITIGAFAVTVSVLAAQEQIGLFHLVAAPYWLAVVGSVIALDLAIYWQHRLFHAIPIFWRLHRLHHADVDFDVTTGVRFHPIEIFLSMFIKAALVLLLGAPLLAVVLFEVLLSATSLFNHGNVAIPQALDRLLRLILVTPDMHRVHHSSIKRETDSNFGFSVPWWDYLFASYCAQPEAGHDKMQIGLEVFRAAVDNRFDKLLIQPFRNR